MKLILGVDIVLGPVLTFVVYDPTKKNLFLDLLIIGLIQVGAQCIGIWLMYQERPVVEVLMDNGVYVLTAADYHEFGVDLSHVLPAFEGRFPKKVVMDLPEGKTLINHVRFLAEFIDKRPLYFRTDLYLNALQRNEDKVLTLIKKHPWDSSKGCYVVPIYFTRFESEACYQIGRGIVSVY